MPEVRAVADIGSNTVHLLVARANSCRLERIENRSEWLALGEEVAKTGSVSAKSLATLSTVLTQYRALAESLGAKQLQVFATEAIRAASNSSEVLAQISRRAQILVDVISPAQEAELSLRGVSLDAPETPAVLFEVGGGSAQVALCEGGSILQEYSLPIGTGNLIARSGLGSSRTPEALAELNRLILEAIETLPKSFRTGLAVGSGGIARGLVRSLHPDGDQTLLPEEIAYLESVCRRITPSTIAKRFRVKPKRAVSLLPGALVFFRLLERFAIESVFVSEYGVREGALLSMVPHSRKGL